MDYRDLDLDKSFIQSLKVKLTLLILFSIFAPFVNMAQKKADIGIMSGVNYYMGDINPSKHFYNPGIIYSGSYRYNLNKRYSVKGIFTYTTISGSDSDFPNNLIQVQRNEDFSSKIYDFSVQIEHNFWPYMTTMTEEERYSPYIFVGFTSLYSIGESNRFDYGVPFGAGFKFNLNKRFGIGFEYSFKKLFTDKIDGLSYRNTAFNFEYTKDWYVFTGFFVSYKIFTKNLLCPAYND